MTREEAIELLVNATYSDEWQGNERLTEANLMAIEALHQERPKGEWIFKTVFPNDKSEFPMGYLVCPVCGSHHKNSTPCNFCDNCGADMRGDKECG